MSIAEEALMAYADGTLPAGERARVEAALAADPALAGQVALLRAGGRAARDAFAGVLDEPVPPRLLAAIAAASGPASPATVATPGWEGTAAPRQGLAGPRPLPAATRASRPAAPWFARRGGLAIAASLLLGVLGGWTLHEMRVSPPGGPGALGPALQAALDKAPSGTLAGEARLIASHRAADGQVCRSFAVPAPGTAAAGMLQGLACRGSGSGGWALRAMVARGAGGAGSFAPASAEDPVLAEMLDRLGAGPALTEQEERAAMARAWSPDR
jgi:anti-sigma factor RsiW